VNGFWLTVIVIKLLYSKNGHFSYLKILKKKSIKLAAPTEVVAAPIAILFCNPLSQPFYQVSLF
jgi:hypothetical protein